MQDYKAGSLLALTLTAVRSCIAIWNGARSVTIQAIKDDIYCSQHKHAVSLLNTARCIVNLAGWCTSKEQGTLTQLIPEMWSDLKNNRYLRLFFFCFFLFNLWSNWGLLLLAHLWWKWVHMDNKMYTCRVTVGDFGMLWESQLMNF